MTMWQVLLLAGKISEEIQLHLEIVHSEMKGIFLTGNKLTDPDGSNGTKTRFN